MSPLLLRRLSDELLGSRLASGEAAAFDELYRRYVHRLAAYGAHLLGDMAAGDDVAQTALLKAYGALRDGRVPERVKPWLYRIAHNTAIDLASRRRDLPTAELPERPVAENDGAGSALVAALAALPERQRRVYVLRELHGLRIDETAGELGMTSTQVEQSLFAARNRLAEQLVFGDRLNCVAVQRLAEGPLDAEERRALKTHLRSCASCRHALGLRGRALELLPAATFDWLRGLAAALTSGGAPAAAKVGALVATASLAGAVPITVERSNPRHPVAVARHAVARVERSPVRATAPRPQLVAAKEALSVPRVSRDGTEHHHRTVATGGDGGRDTTRPPERHDGGGPGDHADAVATVPTGSTDGDTKTQTTEVQTTSAVATTTEAITTGDALTTGDAFTTATTETSHDGGGGDGGGGDITSGDGKNFEGG